VSLNIGRFRKLFVNVKIKIDYGTAVTARKYLAQQAAAFPIYL
jgi:hypothetical protein